MTTLLPHGGYIDPTAAHEAVEKPKPRKNISQLSKDIALCGTWSSHQIRQIQVVFLCLYKIRENFSVCSGASSLEQIWI